MGYQQKSYKKFVATAATATLVASAIVPVASAKSFSDVDVTNDHFEAIDALSDLGVISGYTDGSYGVNKTVTRSSAVKILGKWLVNAQGFEIPKDALTVARFNDLPVDSADKELVEYAAVVKDAGVFTGSNGNLNAAGTLTRQQMAKVLVEAFNTVYEIDLVADLPKDFESKLTDLDSVFDSFTDYVKVLEYFEITKTANNTFNPTGSVTRGQLASFLYRALNNIEVVVELTVKSVDVKDAKTLEVTLSDDSKHTVTLEKALEANKATEVTFTIDEVEYKATVTYVVEGLKVESVSAINGKQILVKFSDFVGTGVNTLTNYGVTTVTTTANNPVTNAEVQADGKSVLLTLTNGYRVTTDVVVTVDNIYKKDSIKDKFARYSGVITVADTTAPTITSVKSSTSTNAAQVVTVAFSEPLLATPTFKINGTVVTGAPASTPGVYTLTGVNLSVDKVHSLEVLNFEDFADNKVTYVTQNFSVTKDATPATGKVKVLQDNKIEITFDKAMNLASLDLVDVLYYNATSKQYELLTLNDLTGSYNAKLSADGKVATFEIANSDASKIFGLNDTTEELVVKVKNGVVDAVGNAVVPFEQRVITTQDVTGPALENVTFAKNSKGEVETLYFHFDEPIAAALTHTNFLTEADVIVTDKSTNTVVADNDTIFGAALAAGDVTLATDGKTIVVKPAANATNKLTAGEYEFEIAKDLVADTAFASNKNKKTSKVVNFGTATNQVTVTNVVVNEAAAVDNVVTVTFSHAVTLASAKNPANYVFNGKALPADTTIQVLSDTEVKFTLPANFIEKSDNSGVVQVNGIVPQNSALTFKNYVGTEKVLDNTAPVVAGSVVKDGTIQLTFTDGGTVTPVAADFIQVKLNGKLVATTGTAPTVLTKAVETLPDSSKVVTIKVVPKVATNFNSTGFTYQYVDVDGDDNLDFTKDIVLQSVQAATAPGTWSTTVSDLNLLSSVEVITDATTATKDDSAYQATGAAAAGNTIKANNTIKVK